MKWKIKSKIRARAKIKVKAIKTKKLLFLRRVYKNTWEIARVEMLLFLVRT